ncbi:MAG: GTP pyrophosphokinase, partial [Rhodocyclaceae bacterium UTPRO2]
MVSVTHSIAQAGAEEAQLELLAEGLPPEARDALARAADYARGLYGESILGTGEPAWQHALGIALVAASLRLDLDTRQAALLFAVSDYLEDAPEKLAGRFGQPIAELVDGLRRLKGLQLVTGKDERAQSVKAQAEVLRKMLLAMSHDIRVVLLRLASRTQTLRHLADHPEAERAEVARETLEVLAPLANRLGLWQLKWELEDLAFRFLDPDTYRELARQLEERRAA